MDFRRAGMQRHAHLDPDRGRPGFRVQGALGRDRRRQRVGCVDEGRADCITDRLEHDAAARLDRRSEDVVVAPQRGAHHRRVALP
jgi:hypothetical protein